MTPPTAASDSRHQPAAGTGLWTRLGDPSLDHTLGAIRAQIVRYVRVHPGAGATAIATGGTGLDLSLTRKVCARLIESGHLVKTLGGAAAAGIVRRLPLADAEWAGRYDAIDLVAGRLHDYACEAATCSDTCWMSWTGAAIAALDGAHVHTHHHTTGRRLVIEIDLPADDPDRRDDDCGAGGWCA